MYFLYCPLSPASAPGIFQFINGINDSLNSANADQQFVGYLFSRHFMVFSHPCKYLRFVFLFFMMSARLGAIFG